MTPAVGASVRSARGSSLTRHSVMYAVARGVPGIINFAVPAVYTRLVTPEIFGRYAVVVAWVALGNALLFNWLRLSVLRFLPSRQGQPVRASFLSTIFLGYVLASAGASCLAALAFVAAPSEAVRPLIVCGFLALMAQAWIEIHLELLRAQLAPAKYGTIFTLRAAFSLLLGALFARCGYGAVGMIGGTSLGVVLSSAWSVRNEWRGARLRLADALILRECARYGFPLTIALAFSYVVSTSDRLLLSWLLGPGSAGLYAAGYDIAQSAVVGVLLPIGLASFPLAVRAMDRSGPTEAAREMSRNLLFLLLLGVPAAVGLSVLAPNVAHTLLAEEFRGSARSIIPWIAFAGLTIGAIELHFNRVFQLTKQTWLQVRPYAAAACVNVLLNLWLIPKCGLMGAVYSTVAAYVLALGWAWKMAHKALPLAFPRSALLKILVAAIAMGGALALVRDAIGAAALVGQVVLGGLVYMLVLLALYRATNPLTLGTRLAAECRQVVQ